MNYTSIEQSKKLIELGLNPESADMYYFLDPTPVGNIYIPSLIFIEKHLKSRMPEYNKGDIPCWSVGALIRLMPCIIKKNYHLSINNANIFYSYYDSYQGGTTFTEKACYGDLLKTCFNIVVWLLKNGYIKKGE